MPEDLNTTIPGQAPAANPATPPAPAATNNTTPDTLAVDGKDEQISLEEARKLRKENQSLRARQKTIDDAKEAKRLAELSDVEKANKQVSDLQQKYDAEHKQHISALVQIAAHKKGIIDPDLAALAIESQLEFGDDGKPSNLDKLLDELIKNKPYLAAKPAEPTTTPAQQQRPTPQFTANNPGRGNIQQPGQPLSPGQWPTLGDVFKKP